MREGNLMNRLKEALDEIAETLVEIDGYVKSMGIRGARFKEILEDVPKEEWSKYINSICSVLEKSSSEMSRKIVSLVSQINRLSRNFLQKKG